jgi:hypothetical protein
MDERQKKAFDFAADLTKQLITLSTGIVTITLLLSKDLIGPRWLAVAAWTFYLLSTVFGLWALMALTGTLAPLKKNPAQPAGAGHREFEIGRNVRIPSILQVSAFGIATLLTLGYVFVAFAHPSKGSPPAQNCSCSCISAPPSH